ncbi:A1 cistron-splicing factor [Hyaloraphidium curvatum]|nr:A1 cistron-splicing factor [Hyaloraphidium curvatum]
MDNDTLVRLFETGAIVLFLDAPLGLEFGIDYSSWETGPRFRGAKLIPPGLHFVYYSARSKAGETAVRTGFFAFLEPKQIVVKQWNPETEDVFEDSELDPDQVERYKFNIREFEPYLGPYPLIPDEPGAPNMYHRWLVQTSYISKDALKRILPPSGKVSGMTSTSLLSEVPEPRARAAGKGKGPPPQAADAANESLRINFTPFDLRMSFPPTANGPERTKYSLDKSWLLEQLIRTEYEGDYRLLLAELQLSFLVFLIGQVFDGLEQWKKLIGLLCQCDEALARYGATLFAEFAGVLLNQLEDVPEDFFIDALSGDNFLGHMLKNFVLLQRDADIPLPAVLRSRTDALLDHLRDKHRWDLRGELADLIPEDDISETGEYYGDGDAPEPEVVELDPEDEEQ